MYHLSSLFFAPWPWYDSPNMAGELMTKDDLMAYLRISLPTVNRLMAAGLPFVKLAKGKGRVLFRKADVDAYLESKIVKNKPQGRTRKV
jgi:excisionase family DNA binding protein